jgi:Ca2+/H+ antiporter
LVLLPAKTIILGLDPVDKILFQLTLPVTEVTFASAQANVLLGSVRCWLFLTYVMLTSKSNGAGQA